MRKMLAVTGLAVVAFSGLAVTTTAAEAATTYAPKAALSGSRYCQESTGMTRQRVLLDNRGSNATVQYRVVWRGDKGSGSYYTKVAARSTKTTTISIPEGIRMGLTVTSPEKKDGWLVMSKTVEALASCTYKHFEPKASLGKVTCMGSDAIVQVVLDNRLSTDAAVEYGVTTQQPDSDGFQSVRVPAETRRNTYVSVPSGQPVGITVAVGDNEMLTETVPGTAC